MITVMEFFSTHQPRRASALAELFSDWEQTAYALHTLGRVKPDHELTGYNDWSEILAELLNHAESVGVQVDYDMVQELEDLFYQAPDQSNPCLMALDSIPHKAYSPSSWMLEESPLMCFVVLAAYAAIGGERPVDFMESLFHSLKHQNLFGLEFRAMYGPSADLGSIVYGQLTRPEYWDTLPRPLCWLPDLVDIFTRNTGSVILDTPDSSLFRWEFAFENGLSWTNDNLELLARQYREHVASGLLYKIALFTRWAMGGNFPDDWASNEMSLNQVYREAGRTYWTEWQVTQAVYMGRLSDLVYALTGVYLELVLD